MPTLRAATEIDVAQGSYYSPENFFQMKGDPVLIALPKPARDEASARKLWEISEKLTGVQFRF